MTQTVLRVTASFLFAFVLAAGAAGAQSLADVAKSSNTGRKSPPKPSKVYTNENLKQDITPSSPTAAPAEGAAAPSTDAAAAAPAADATPAAEPGARDEKYWKDRMKAAREGLERNETLASALQSQINGLTTDFINTDDPAQRAAVGQRRTKAVADLERAQRDITAAKKSIAAVEDEARRAGVPAGWLR